MASLILTAVFAVFVLVSALVGLVRGLNKATIRLITLLLAAALTFAIAGPVSKAIVEAIHIEGMTLSELIADTLSDEDAISDMMEALPLLREMIQALPAFVLSFVMFPVMFWALKFITWIVFCCVQKPLRRVIFKERFEEDGPAEDGAEAPKGSAAVKRLGGLGVGIVTGMVIFAMLFTPLFGLFGMLPPSSSVDHVLELMVEQEMISAADVDLIRQVYGITDCTLVKVHGMVGVSAAGKAYLNSASKFQVDGQTLYLAEELNSLMSMVQSLMDNELVRILGDLDDEKALFQLLSDKQLLNSLLEDMLSSKIVSTAVPQLLATAMHGVANSLDVPANKQAVYNNMMEDVASAVRNSDVDFAGIQAYEDAHNIASSFARSFGLIFSAEELMSEEEYEAEVKKLVALTDQISKALNTALSGDNAAFTDSVAQQIVSNVKAQVAANGGEAIANFDAKAAISNVDSANLAGEGAAALLEQLSDENKFETDVATVETITDSIMKSVQDALSDEEKAAETAHTLANVVSNLASAVSEATDENGEIDVSKLDFNKIADAVTELQNSNLKGVGSSMLDMVSSGDLGDNGMIGDLLGAVKEGYDKGEDIGGTISSAGALIGLGSSMGGENDQEAMVNSLTDLINNLNDFTISLLPNILSDDTIESMGVPAEYAKATFGVIETLLKELMKLKGAEDYTNEVNSIVSLYNLATSGVEEFTQEDIAGLVNYAVESDAIFNTLVSVSVSNPFGIEIPAESRAELVGAIEDHYANSGKTPREHDIYAAVATLLGLDGEVKLG